MPPSCRMSFQMNAKILFLLVQFGILYRQKRYFGTEKSGSIKLFNAEVQAFIAR